MAASGSTYRPEKKMAIITSYFKGEAYGLLGPQMAATIIEDHGGCECIVIAVTREDEKAALKKILADYFADQKPVIGFSALSGREDLFSLAGELRKEGAVTILAGPQAGVDFSGEKGWRSHSHRFKGYWEYFDYGLQGPAEQVVPLLGRLSKNSAPATKVPGLLYLDREGDVRWNLPKEWDSNYLGKVRWDNIYRIAEDGLVPLKTGTGQVLQHIGCPHAARRTRPQIDYPAAIQKSPGQNIEIGLKGCSFCDVAADKGFHGKLDTETVIAQIQCLPQTPDGRKIPFELINENPLPALSGLLQEVHARAIEISQINLTLRADGLVSGLQHLKAALKVAGDLGIYVLLSSIGFESFDDRILRNLNKGLSVETNIEAIRLIRQLKEEFGEAFGYASREGANHGFIHPTAWDTEETAAEIQKNIYLYGLQNDILPPHSTPLIIHHASGLADWIREIEDRERLRFKRYGTVIGWWEEPRRI
jgi:hypothetical protein